MKENQKLDRGPSLHRHNCDLSLSWNGFFNSFFFFFLSFSSSSSSSSSDSEPSSLSSLSDPDALSLLLLLPPPPLSKLLAESDSGGSERLESHTSSRTIPDSEFLAPNLNFPISNSVNQTWDLELGFLWITVKTHPTGINITFIHEFTSNYGEQYLNWMYTPSTTNSPLSADSVGPDSPSESE